MWKTLSCWVQGKVRVTRSLGSEVYISDGTPLPEPPQDFWESERFEVRPQPDCRVGKQSVCDRHALCALAVEAICPGLPAALASECKHKL